ncbi:MAG: hypothetical protein KGP29_03390 [Proteobacteria bacterium]|nr:hypothetical protein [Pseudomonadota bacterium]
MRNFFCLIILLGLFSCGFQVIYRNEVNSFSYSEDLASIRIKKDRNHLSQELKNNLYDLLNPDYIKAEPKYFLILRTSKTISGTLITQTGASGRNKITIEVSYDLKNLENNAIISRGITSVNDSYDVSTNRYGTYVSEETVENNLTKIAAQNIRNAIVNDFIEVKKKCSGEMKVEDEEYEIKEAFDDSKYGNGKGGQIDPMATQMKVIKEKFVCPFVVEKLTKKESTK